MKKSVVVLFILLMSFSFVSAAWWNPFDWFKSELGLSPESYYVNGLPVDFEPILGYTHNQNLNGEMTILWDEDGRVFFLEPNSDVFLEFTEGDKDDWGLGGFKAIVGYSHTFNGVNNELLSLWDRNGNVKFMRTGDTSFTDYNEDFDSDGDRISDREEQRLLGFNAILGYTNFLGGRERISLWDKDGNAKVMAKGDSGFSNYDETLDSDRDGVSDREEQGLKGVKAVEGYYHPKDDTVFLWDAGGDMLKWDWDAGEFEVVESVGISGVPAVAYYDDERKEVVVWFGNKEYRSEDGIGFGKVRRVVDVGENEEGLITIEGEYSGLYNFPEEFFTESDLTPEEVIEVIDKIYLLEVDLAGEELPFYIFDQDNFVRGSYNEDAYGVTTPEGFAIGPDTFPSKNNGYHAWDVIAHEIGHGFWSKSLFFYGMSVPGPFLQEATAVLSAQYVYEKIKLDPNNYGLNQKQIASLDAVFEEEREYQKSRYEEYIKLGMPYSQDESGPNYAILTSQAMNYEWFLIGDEYGWGKFSKFYRAFSDDLREGFDFWGDGTVSDIQETTYMVVALSAAFDMDFRERFRNLNFPIDDDFYEKVFPVVEKYVGSENEKNVLKLSLVPNHEDTSIKITLDFEEFENYASLGYVISKENSVDFLPEGVNTFRFVNSLERKKYEDYIANLNPNSEYEICLNGFYEDYTTTGYFNCETIRTENPKDENILIMKNYDLDNEINDLVDRWLIEVQNENPSFIIEEMNFGKDISSEEVYEILKKEYSSSNLKYVVFIGWDLPIPKIELRGEEVYSSFPYTSLSFDTWNDNNGFVNPTSSLNEISVAIIKTNNGDQNEMKDYFSRLISYYQNTKNNFDSKIFIATSMLASEADIRKENYISSMYSDNQIDFLGEITNYDDEIQTSKWKNDYRIYLINNNYDFLLLNSHGSVTGHQFDVNSDFIEALNHNVKFIITSSCNIGNYMVENSPLLSYVFSGNSLAGVGFETPYLEVDGATTRLIYNRMVENGMNIADASRPQSLRIIGDPFLKNKKLEQQPTQEPNRPWWENCIWFWNWGNARCSGNPQPNINYGTCDILWNDARFSPSLTIPDSPVSFWSRKQNFDKNIYINLKKEEINNVNQLFNEDNPDYYSNEIAVSEEGVYSVEVCEGNNLDNLCCVPMDENLEVKNLEILPLFENHNDKDADRINLVFLLVDFTDIPIATEWVKESLAFEDGRIITIYPESFSDRTGEINPEQIVLDFGAFSIEPFKSNKNKFNFWYLPLDLGNNDVEYQKLIDSLVNSNNDYLSFFNLQFVHPVIIRASPRESYDYIRQSARVPSFFGEEDIDKEALGFGYFFESVGIDESGEITIQSQGSHPLLWTHEMGHSLFGLADEYPEPWGEEGERKGEYIYPNCARDEFEASEWWGDLIGQIDPTYYELIDISEGFYEQYNTEDNYVSIPQLCDEGVLRTSYINGKCGGDSNADVFIRPTVNSLMNQYYSCPVLGSVNRRRAEQVLDLFSGE